MNREELIKFLEWLYDQGYLDVDPDYSNAYEIVDEYLNEPVGDEL